MKKYLIFIITCLLSFIFQIRLSAQIQINDESWSKIDQEVNRLLEKEQIPGLSLIVVNKGQTWLRHFGYANLEKSIAVDAQTNFEIGSCTKAFTGLALLHLEKQGLIDLEENVTTYLPWLDVSYQEETVELKVRHLL